MLKQMLAYNKEKSSGGQKEEILKQVQDDKKRKENDRGKDKKDLF
jgi:hypothetical protein